MGLGLGLGKKLSFVMLSPSTPLGINSALSYVILSKPRRGASKGEGRRRSIVHAEGIPVTLSQALSGSLAQLAEQLALNQ